MNDLYAQIGRLNLRLEALERRVYKLEDVVNEILRRTAREPSLVQPAFRASDSEQLPSDSDL